MNDDPSNTALPLDEQLVAYLDGELDPESSRRIEELLATDAEVRRRLQEMERTWDLLDDLDAAPVGGQFTQSTLEMVAVAAQKDVDQSMAEAPRRRRRRALAATGALLVAVVLGFLAVVLLWPDPNQDLLHDLPVLENLDEYRQVENIEFLRLLANEGLFSKENGETPGSVLAPSDESLAQRRQRIESMTPNGKEKLLRLQERFDTFGQDQQQRLRRLDEAIEESADALQLRRVMHRYCEWLKTLPSYSRAELAELEPASRIKSVKKQLEAEQKREGGKRPGGKDMEVLWKWMNEWATRHEAQLLEMLPQSQRDRLAKSSPQMRQRAFIHEIWQPWQAAGAGTPPPKMTADDWKWLRERLSPETCARLEPLSTTEQWRMVAGWMRRQRPAHGPLPPADDERLLNFFEKELKPEDRDWLLSLPGEQMQQELQRLYRTRTRPREPNRRLPPAAITNH